MTTTARKNPLRRNATVAGLVATSALALLYVFPVARIIVEGFRWKAVSEVATDGRFRSVAWFSLWQALASTVGVLVIALPLAGLFSHRRLPGRKLLLALIAAPFTLPTVVVAAALRETMPTRFSSGVVAILCAHIFYNVGMATLILLPRFEQVDQSLTDAAMTLGATRTQAARTITLPLVGPAIRNAALLTFTLCFTSFGVVVMLGGARRTTIDVEIYRQALQRLRLDRASVLAMLQLLVLATLAFLASRSSPIALSNRPQRPRSPRRLPTAGRVGAPVAFCVVVTLLSLPLLALVRRSLREPSGTFGFANYRALAHRTRGSGLAHTPLSAFSVSARSAVLAAVIALLIGTGLAVAAAEARRSGSGFRLLASLPLATSSVQLGLGFLIAFAAAPVAWRSRWFAVPLVQAVVAVPFVVRQISPVLDALPRARRNAAMTLGASPWRAWGTIDLRIARPAFTSAFALAFAISLGEFGAATFLARPETATVPVAIARLSGLPGPVVQGQAAAMSTLLAGLTLFVVLVGRTVGSSGDAATGGFTPVFRPVPRGVAT